MASVTSVQRNMETRFTIELIGDNLDNNHLVKDIVYIINEFAKEKAYLFPERNFEGKSGPKFKNELQELLGLQVFATLRLQRTCRKIQAFLSDNNEACKYITNNELPKKIKNKPI